MPDILHTIRFKNTRPRNRRNRNKVDRRRNNGQLNFSETQQIMRANRIHRHLQYILNDNVSSPYPYISALCEIVLCGVGFVFPFFFLTLKKALGFCFFFFCSFTVITSYRHWWGMKRDFNFTRVR